MKEKTLSAKLANIRAGEYRSDQFIIADAKDADMGFGCAAPGVNRSTNQFHTKAHYLSAMEAMCRSGLIDIMLLSASSAEQLSGQPALDNSGVTTAVRMNDTTDIWSARNSVYREHRSVPFSTCNVGTAAELCNLGLYSVTFSNNLNADLYSLECYKAFRYEAREHHFQHFLEVFNPAMDVGIPEAELGFYINDMIVKALAGVTQRDMPQFLKLQFNGAKAMEELSQYDPQNIIVGILGGAKGTTRDTFELLTQAEAAGARVALFGRKINLAESPISLVTLMRECLNGSFTPEQAVVEYHNQLASQGIAPETELQADLQITDSTLKR